MESDSHVDEYLKRIGVNRSPNGPTEDYLNQLHIGHLTYIPFETFDLIDLKQLNISPDHIFDRLVRQHRGGVCYQMNGLFASILKHLGYNVQIIPCSVYSDAKEDYLTDYDHASLSVTLNNGRRFLCDVGFSKDFLTPLFFQTDCIQFATNGFFRLTKTDDGLYYKLERGFPHKDDPISLPSPSSPQTSIIDINPERIQWTRSYRFSDKSVQLIDFEDQCFCITHSPEVLLNHHTICHIHTYQPVIGAYSIAGKEYSEWIRINGIQTRQHHPLSADDNELKTLLKEKFRLNIERKLELVDGL